MLQGIKTLLVVSLFGLLAGCAHRAPQPASAEFVGSVTEYRSDGTMLKQWLVDSYDVAEAGVKFTVPGDPAQHVATGIVVARPKTDPSSSDSAPAYLITLYSDSFEPLMEFGGADYHYSNGTVILRVDGSSRSWIIRGKIYARPAAARDTASGGRND